MDDILHSDGLAMMDPVRYAGYHLDRSCLPKIDTALPQAPIYSNANLLDSPGRNMCAAAD